MAIMPPRVRNLSLHILKHPRLLCRIKAPNMGRGPNMGFLREVMSTTRLVWGKGGSPANVVFISTWRNKRNWLVKMSTLVQLLRCSFFTFLNLLLYYSLFNYCGIDVYFLDPSLYGLFFKQFTWGSRKQGASFRGPI